ncbi:protein PNG1 [Colletotrichum abscissum]|uniref:protein PNG1 n=1 Tax=Colletotrichum abscissum TaxID=1671311 RepID=UPI0027D5CF42|nr:protein PNG1 [Colletotrichum abscissum]KAK1517373.1 protein PNG1 [Colletotrichum abscissum]
MAQGSSTGCQKLHTFVGGAKMKRSATAGGLVSFRNRFMFHTVQHVLEEIPTHFNTSGNHDDVDETDNEIEITGWSDFENDDDEPALAYITSRGSISPQSETAGSAGSDIIADEAWITSRPAQAEHGNELHSRLQELVPSTAQVPSMDQHSYPTVTGEVVLSSKELDFALVEVSPSVLPRPGDAEGQTQAVPLETYMKYVESAPRDAAVSVTTPDGRSIGGALSGTPSLFRPPGCRTLIDVYTAKLSRPIISSEHGSWVRDAISGKIYGHIVAGSRFPNDVLIVPAHQVLHQALKILKRCESGRTVGEADPVQDSEHPGVKEILQRQQDDLEH